MPQALYVRKLFWVSIASLLCILAGSVGFAQESSGGDSAPVANSPTDSDDASENATSSTESVDTSGEDSFLDTVNERVQHVDKVFGDYVVKNMAFVIFNGLDTESRFGIKIPVIVIWLFIGACFFTIYFGFINIRGFWHALRLTKGDYDDPDNEGEVSHFQALSSALSGTVGLGNIAGVAIAIGSGGPGATFWMILVGLLGMSSKFTECTLGQMYRKVDDKGRVSGGPMRYLKDGLTEMNLRPLGIALSILFSILCIGGSFGGGNTFQISQSLDAIRTEVPVLNQYPFLYGLAMAVAVGLVIVGGIRSIGKVASRIVPFMCAGYVLCVVYILAVNYDQIGEAFSRIFTEAFNPVAVKGGFLGCMVIGIKRAVFSNEAGAGSASIAHSAAKTDIPVREGYVALLEPFIDTVVVCTMTALVIIITGVVDDKSEAISATTARQELVAAGVESELVEKYSDTEAVDQLLAVKPDFDKTEDGKLTVADLVAADRGAYFTKEAFVRGGFPWFRWFLYAAIILFAYSTCISWYYYGERCFTNLFGDWSSGLFKLLFLTSTFLGSVIATTNIKDFSDMLILGMAFPNMFGMYFLSGKVRAQLRDYLGKLRDGTIKPHVE